MGHVHLSFEYHIHKSCLKIRVWQLSDVLLPPPQISMIQSVYVRSFLTPADTKRQVHCTEEVRVENLEAHVNVKPQEQKRLTGIQHIFTPSNFKFLSPLQYADISVDVVREKGIQIEVCMIQKTTRKSFLIGMINIPLKQAVKKVVREKIPLIPCLNYTTPNNMRVYSATDLDLEGNGDLFYCSPSLKQLNGHEPRPEFEDVMEPDDNLIKHVHINIRHKKRDSNDNEVKAKNGDFDSIENSNENGDLDMKKLENGYSEHDLENDSPTENKSDSKTTKLNQETDTKHDKKLIKVNLNDLEISEMMTKNQVNPDKIDPKSPLTDKRTKLKVPSNLDIDGSDNEIEEYITSVKNASPAAASSRPETPVWDYYDFALEEGIKVKQKESKTSTSSTKSNDSDVIRSN